MFPQLAVRRGVAGPQYPCEEVCPRGAVHLPGMWRGPPCPSGADRGAQIDALGPSTVHARLYTLHSACRCCVCIKRMQNYALLMGLLFNSRPAQRHSDPSDPLPSPPGARPGAARLLRARLWHAAPPDGSWPHHSPGAGHPPTGLRCMSPWA